MPREQPLHDAQKILADLRDQLARHDKPIAFLFGAGTSCAVSVPSSVAPNEMQPLIPAVAALTAFCCSDVGEMGEKFGSAWSSIVEHCTENGLHPNVENVLSRLRMMMSAIGNADTLYGLNKAEIEVMEASVRKTIARLVMPDLSTIPNELPHRRFARWLGRTARKNPVEVFTLNYDVLIEHGLELERIPCFDGFVGSFQPFFHSDSLRRVETAPGANWTRLWKVHGSVTWRRIEQNGRMRVVRGAPDLAGEMIFPSFQKYDESRQQPYSAFTERLTRFLDQDDALLVTAGFSFGDEHINNLVFGALENRPRTHVYALQFGDPEKDSDLAVHSAQRTNVIVIGREMGIIGGRRAKWAPAECPTFMQDVFETLEEGTDDSGEGETSRKSGHMKIGDFSAFCKFLDSMSAA